VKVVYATRSAGHFSYVSPVASPLSAAGHEVEMLFHPELAKDFPTLDELQRLCEHDKQTAGWVLRRPSLARWFIEAGRNLLTYSTYLTRTDQSRYYRRRWEQYLPSLVRWSLRVPGARSILGARAIKAALRRLERLVPPERKVLDYLKEKRPDVLVASPLNYWGSEEVEYVKAAQSLGIPTVLHVFSWDNLTTKSLLYLIPDLVLVWNQKQVEEAVEIHGVPADRIVITGAPHFDELIALKGQGSSGKNPAEERAEFCAKAGLDPRRPYVVYLGSSSFVAADETWMVGEIARSLRGHSNPALRDLQVLVRPHPAHAKIYEGIEGDSLKVWPRKGAKLGSPGFMQDFHDTLRHGLGAIGINTSGMFNAVVMDKPCVTVLASRYRETQEEAMHFQHLLEGDVLETSQSPAECADVMERIWRGEDVKARARQKFVEDWIRPRGLEHPAGEIIRSAVELLAGGKSPAEIDREIDSQRKWVQVFLSR
jgi:hypothetical protein